MLPRVTHAYVNILSYVYIHNIIINAHISIIRCQLQLGELHNNLFQDWNCNKMFVNTLVILFSMIYNLNPACCNNSDFYL